MARRGRNETGFTSSRRSAQQGFTSSRRSAQQGFTLLEMLVALAVFSLAALALVRLQAVAVRTAADLDGHSLARIVAHNRMVEVQTAPEPLSVGDSKGEAENGGRSWRWTQSVTKTDAGNVVRVDVKVVPASGIGSPVVLTFLKAQP